MCHDQIILCFDSVRANHMGFQGSYSTFDDYEGLAEVCSNICIGLHTRHVKLN